MKIKKIPLIIIKEATVQYSKPKSREVGHFFLQIPKVISRELDLKKGEKAVFTLYLKNKKRYSIRFKKLP